MIQCPKCCLYSENTDICGVCGFNFHSDPLPQVEERLFAPPPAICPACGYISSNPDRCLACGASIDAEELMRCSVPIGGSIGGVIEEMAAFMSSESRHDDSLFGDVGDPTNPAHVSYYYDFYPKE